MQRRKEEEDATTVTACRRHSMWSIRTAQHVEYKDGTACGV
jgi:hypothetical protein